MVTVAHTINATTTTTNNNYHVLNISTMCIIVY